MDKKMDHEQSLALINEMIVRARNNLRKGSMRPMLLCGYSGTGIAVANFVLLHTLNDPNLAYLVWWLMFPVGIAAFLMVGRRREALVKTHIDKIISTVWIAFIICMCVFFAVIYTVVFKKHDPRILFLVTPVISVMIGGAQYISACVYRCKSLYYAAGVFWIGAIACSFFRQDFQLLIFAVSLILGYIIPGHYLNGQIKKADV